MISMENKSSQTNVNTNKKPLLENNNFLKVASIILAAICWVAVASADSTSLQRKVKEIPLNVAAQEEALAELGLNIIDININEVSANITGKRTAIGKIKPEDLTATIQLPRNYVEPGIYDLPVVPVTGSYAEYLSAEDGYKLENYAPETVKVVLDRLERLTLPIELQIDGEVTVQEGYIQEKAPVLNPKEVVISGPKTELDKIERAVVKMTMNETLEKPYAGEHEVQLLDAQGNMIDLESHHLNLDNVTSQVVISVLKEKELPLSFEFQKPPRGFPDEELEYKMSNYEIKIAGPVDMVDKHKELLLGFIDISDISITENTFTFDVELPDKFINLENIMTVTVDFNTSDLRETVFDLNNINILNIPNDYDIKLVTTSVPNVKLVGKKDIIANLVPEDVVVEIDMSEKKDINLGQYQYPVKISVPNKGLVWATGEYNVVVQVVEEGTVPD